MWKSDTADMNSQLKFISERIWRAGFDGIVKVEVQPWVISVFVHEGEFNELSPWPSKLNGMEVQYEYAS